MKNKFENLRKALLAGGDSANPQELLSLYAEGLQKVFGSDAHGGLVRFSGGAYEASFGESGSLCVSAASDCPLTGGAFEPVSVDGDTVLRLRIGRSGKREDLVVVIVGNKFLPARARISLSRNHVRDYTDWLYWSMVGRAERASVPRNWKESLSAALRTVSERGSVFFFAPAEEKKFPDIWAFEERLDDWIQKSVLPLLIGSRRLYLTNGIFAVVCDMPSGTARDLVNEVYRGSSYRNGKLDFRAAVLPVPLYFKETFDPFSVLCTDAMRLLATCDGDSVASSLSRFENEADASGKGD